MRKQYTSIFYTMDYNDELVNKFIKTQWPSTQLINKLIHHMKQYEDEYNDTVDEKPWGDSDSLEYFPGNYVLSYNKGLGYASLTRVDYLPGIDADQYEIERAICDKANDYAQGIMLGKRNYLTASEANHPIYKACNNAMRGRVEQYEILTQLPEIIVAYINDNNAATTWTGDVLSHDGVCSSSWRVDSHIGSHMYQYLFDIGNRRYTGRGFGEGMSIILRETAASKRLSPR